MQAPATYAAAPNPVIWPWVMWMPLPGMLIWPEIWPTIVTSRPSRIQTVPSPMMIIQCHRDQGSRSSRAGTLVLIVPVCTSLTGLSLLLAAATLRAAGSGPRYPRLRGLFGR